MIQLLFAGGWACLRPSGTRRPRADFFFSSRRRHTRSYGDWSSDVCSSDLNGGGTLSQSRTVHTSSVGAAVERNASAHKIANQTIDTRAAAANGEAREVTRPPGGPGPCPSLVRSEERRVGKEWRSRVARGRA